MVTITSLFLKFDVSEVDRYGAKVAGVEGSVQHATISLNGQSFTDTDSNVKRQSTRTTTMSLYVDCDSEDEIDELHTEWSRGRQVMMPLDSYPCSKPVGWLADKYGVSWQLSLA